MSKRFDAITLVEWSAMVGCACLMVATVAVLIDGVFQVLR